MKRGAALVGEIDQGKPKPNRWSGRSRGGRAGHWVFIQLLRRCGLRAAYALLVPVTAYMLLTSSKGRQASFAYLRRSGILDFKSSKIRRWWKMYQHFYTFGVLLVDRLASLVAPGITFEFEEDGVPHIEQALQHDGGVILLSAHVGNWEVASRAIAPLGRKVNVVAYQGESGPLGELLEQYCGDRPFELIEIDGTANTSLAITAALCRGEIVAMHGDRSIHDTGIRVAVLGDDVTLPNGPFVLAATSGAMLVETFAIRLGHRRYRLIAYPPEQLAFASRQSRQDDIKKWMQTYIERLEARVHEAPLQWWNFYDYWSDTAVPVSKVENSNGETIKHV